MAEETKPLWKLRVEDFNPAGLRGLENYVYRNEYLNIKSEEYPDYRLRKSLLIAVNFFMLIGGCYLSNSIINSKSPEQTQQQDYREIIGTKRP